MSDGYTHDPEAFDEDDEYAPADAEDPGTEREADADTEPEPGAARTHPAAADREFDWRGWTLVAAVFVCFLVVPGVIIAFPYVGPMLGLPFWATYLVLPLLPALGLGALAVWATTRP